VLGLILLCLAPPSWAQAPAPAPPAAGAGAAPPAIPDPISKAAVRDLLSRLSDAEVRELLLQELDQKTEVQAPARRPSLAMRTQAALTAVRNRYIAMFARVPDLAEVPGFFFGTLIGERPAWIILPVVGGLVAVFGLGFFAEWGYRRLTAPVRLNIERAEPRSAGSRLGWLGLRLGLDLFGLVVFALGSIVAFFILHQGHEPVRLTAATILATILVVRAAILVARFVLAPHAERLRLFEVSTADASLLYRQLRLVAIAGGLLIPLDDLLGELGLEPVLSELVGTLGGWTFVAILITAIWRVRAPIAHLIGGDLMDRPPDTLDPAGRVRHLLARAWHVPMTIYVLAIMLTVEVSSALGANEVALPALASLILVMLVPVLNAILVGVSDEFWAQRMAADDPATRTYARLSRRCLHVVMFLLALVAFGEVWDVSVFSMASGSALAARLLDTTIELGLVLLLAYVSWEIVKTMIDRRLAEEGEMPASNHDAGGEGGGPGASRLRTLLPLLRSFLAGTIIVMAVMIVLSSLGVNIGPLLAGAGVVGLAIGFGAQTLVRDIVSGVFFLVDDAFRLGEYIEVGETRGTVEKISIRSLRLRHHRGALHTVPFGEIAQLTNQSRDWVIMKLAFRVPYDTDLTKVKKIFKQIGAELAADPTIGPNLLQPFKSQGVLEVDDSALVVRGKFMAKPGEQFVIRREIFQRVQEKFEANGIQFARRQVSVYVPPAPGGGPPSQEAIAHAAAAAAAAATEDAAAEQKEKAEAR
jgi:small-conductance mechanosensitive channel